MKLVQTVVVRGEADVIDAHIAFHLNAGVDLVLVAGDELQDGVREILDSYARLGYVRLVAEAGPAAAVEHGADWVIPGDPGEFWWPRGESLKEILAAIPQRYGTVRGLVRQFVPAADDGRFFAERMTVRHSVQHDADFRPETSLRAVNRTGPVTGVPLRAWYPIEILRFTVPGAEPIAEPIAEQEREHGLGDGSLVVDTRLRDALHTLRASGSETSGQFAVPTAGAGAFAFPTPDVVDDAAYAVECAAVGEVSLEKLERRIDELEAQLASLERRFWSRVRGRVSRLARSSDRPDARP